jgi:hypothetical protein
VTSQKKLKIADEYPTSLKLITIQRRPPGDQRPGPPLPDAAAPTGHCFLEQHHTGSGKTAQDAKPAYTGEMRKAMHQCALGSRSSSPSSVGVAGGGGGGGCGASHCFLDNSTTATQHVVVATARRSTDKRPSCSPLSTLQWIDARAHCHASLGLISLHAQCSVPHGQ